MKKLSTLIMVVCLFALFSAFAVAGDMPKFATQQRITFEKPMVLVGNELAPGTYRIQHEMQGADHYMIFHRVDGYKKTADVKVKCNLVALNTKAAHTEQRYTENAKHQNVLTELIFQGDEAKHVFETPAL